MAATILASSQLDKEVSVTRKKRQMLKEYYGMVDEDDRGKAFNNSCPPLLNIDGSSFSPDMYLTKLKRDLCLKDLMDSEQNMVKKINSLASEKHNLVYNNYNKFISATDTIRKMKNDFKKMEDEMDRLATNMEAITEFSAKISNTLQDRRQQISKLSGVHSLLKKLQFLFELPAILNKCIESQAYSQAVRYYTKAQRVLYQYQHLPSFHGIQEDCTNIVAELKMKLRDQFKNKKSNPKLLAECIDLLLQLQEPPEELCDEFLSHAKQKIDEDLVLLSNQLKLLKGEPLQKSSDEFERPAEAYLNAPMDILEFIDCGCNGFLSNICLVIASYNDMFLNRQIGSELESMDTIALRKLVNFVMALMERYFNYVEQRVQLERETGDNTILVRALDRFHRRLQAMNKLLPDTDFARTGTDIVSHAAQDRCAHYLDTLKQHFTDCLTDVRHSLAAPKHLTQQDNSNLLNDLLVSMEASVVEQLNSVLANLQAFIHPDITFAMKPYFRGPFCKQHVREDLVVTFFRHITTVSLEFCDGLVEKSSPSPTLILLLSRLCLNFSNSTISSLLTLADEQLMLEDKINLTPESDLCKEAKETAQKLLNSFVRIQGLTISQMLRKSVEIRDWLNTIEPRNVRGVMKRVVEDITAIDSQVGQLYEKGVCKEHSSDSSKRTGFSYSLSRQQQKSTWSNYTPSTLDNSLMSNIQKLFSEKIEIFSSVEFSKMSVLTGIIKISLKTFLECVRLRTFSRYGLQQVQVDTHYLQLYLWRFVSDENLVHVLLDEIVASSANRCLDPQMMEFSVVELICERG